MQVWAAVAFGRTVLARVHTQYAKRQTKNFLEWEIKKKKSHENYGAIEATTEKLSLVGFVTQRGNFRM